MQVMSCIIINSCIAFLGVLHGQAKSKLRSTPSDASWFIDSRTTYHITHDYSLLVNIISLQSELHLPNGHRACVIHTGDIHLTSSIVLKQVLFVPTFQCNLIYIAKFNVDNNCDLILTSIKCLMKDLATRKRKFGDLEGGMFRLHSEKIQDSSGFDFFVSSIQSSEDLSHIWHYRLGHPSSTVLSHIPNLKNVYLLVLNDCDIFHLAKQNKITFHDSNSHSLALFDLIHCDVWDPYKYPIHDNCKYFLTIFDYFSRCTWLFLFMDKTQVFSLIQQFL